MCALCLEVIRGPQNASIQAARDKLHWAHYCAVLSKGLLCSANLGGSKFYIRIVNLVNRGVSSSWVRWLEESSVRPYAAFWRKAAVCRDWCVKRCICSTGASPVSNSNEFNKMGVSRKRCAPNHRFLHRKHHKTPIIWMILGAPMI